MLFKRFFRRSREQEKNKPSLTDKVKEFVEDENGCSPVNIAVEQRKPIGKMTNRELYGLLTKGNTSGKNGKSLRNFVGEEDGSVQITIPVKQEPIDLEYETVEINRGEILDKERDYWREKAGKWENVAYYNDVSKLSIWGKFKALFRPKQEVEIRKAIKEFIEDKRALEYNQVVSAFGYMIYSFANLGDKVRALRYLDMAKTVANFDSGKDSKQYRMLDELSNKIESNTKQAWYMLDGHLKLVGTSLDNLADRIFFMPEI